MFNVPIQKFKYLCSIPTLILINGCENIENDQANELTLEGSPIFEGSEYDPTLGDRHNQILQQFFDENKKNFSNASQTKRFELVDSYFLEKHNLEITERNYELLGIDKSTINARSLNTLANFDPIKVLAQNRDGLSSSAYNQLVYFFDQTGEIQNMNRELVFTDDFSRNINNNSSLTISEKNGINNMVNVYRGSLTYWDQNLDDWVQASNPGYNVNGIPRDAYQKIAWADIIGGAAGGILGGPAGVAVGLASESAIMAIGVSE